jgi:hypothetical protein
MAEYSFYDVTIVRRVYTLRSPTNQAEVAKVFAAIRIELGEKRASYDDAFTVEARDDQIVFSYEKSSTVTHNEMTHG